MVRFVDKLCTILVNDSRHPKKEANSVWHAAREREAVMDYISYSDTGQTSRRCIRGDKPSSWSAWLQRARNRESKTEKFIDCQREELAEINPAKFSWRVHRGWLLLSRRPHSTLQPPTHLDENVRWLGGCDRLVVGQRKRVNHELAVGRVEKDGLCAKWNPERLLEVALELLDLRLIR